MNEPRKPAYRSYPAKWIRPLKGHVREPDGTIREIFPPSESIRSFSRAGLRGWVYDVNCEKPRGSQ
jgi:hypothetical protein